MEYECGEIPKCYFKSCKSSDEGGGFFYSAQKSNKNKAKAKPNKTTTKDCFKSVLPDAGSERVRNKTGK